MHCLLPYSPGGHVCEHSAAAGLGIDRTGQATGKLTGGNTIPAARTQQLDRLLLRKTLLSIGCCFIQWAPARGTGTGVAPEIPQRLISEIFEKTMDHEYQNICKKERARFPAQAS